MSPETEKWWRRALELEGEVERLKAENENRIGLTAQQMIAADRDWQQARAEKAEAQVDQLRQQLLKLHNITP